MSAPSRRQLPLKLTVFYGLVGALLLACFVQPPAPSLNEPGVVLRWPDEVFGMPGKEEPVSEAERVLLPKDTEFAKRSYSDGKATFLSAQTVLSGAERRSIHRPEICLRGQGWNVRSGEVVPVRLKSGHELQLMVLDITRPIPLNNGKLGELPALYAYFFVSKDAETARHFDRIAITNVDLLLRNKTHRWAYVIAMAQVTKGLAPGGRDRAQTLEMIKNFFRESAPEFLVSERQALGLDPARTTARVP